MGDPLNIKKNPLATESVNKLLVKFAVPSIIGMLVSALYNIVDQIFIGQTVGVLGNAATNVAFPLSTICLSIALLFGIGSASNFNLELGSDNKKAAGHFVGNALSMLAIIGVLLFIVVILFLTPLLKIFGATDAVFPFAKTYTGITAFGLPFLILSIGGSNLIRADGSPTYSMGSMLVGALINTILDPILMFGFNMGIAGAAIATVTSQIISCLIVLRYFRHFRSVPLLRSYFRPNLTYVKAIISLGMASCFNQLAMTVVQITMNNTLKHYGELSKYGSDIPLACVGIISKVNIIFMAFVLGISQGVQPIIGFNYGAKNYKRVKEAYFKAAGLATIFSILSFLCFQFLPRSIIQIFGDGNELYFQFGERYFRIFMLFAFLNGIQPVTSNFFTSIGKAWKGMFLALTRQVLFLLPLIIIFPFFLGIDGVMYAGPIADGAAAILAFIFVFSEIRCINKLQKVTVS